VLGERWAREGREERGREGGEENWSMERWWGGTWVRRRATVPGEREVEGGRAGEEDVPSSSSCSSSFSCWVGVGREGGRARGAEKEEEEEEVVVVMVEEGRPFTPVKKEKRPFPLGGETPPSLPPSRPSSSPPAAEGARAAACCCCCSATTIKVGEEGEEEREEGEGNTGLKAWSGACGGEVTTFPSSSLPPFLPSSSCSFVKSIVLACVLLLLLLVLLPLATTALVTGAAEEGGREGEDEEGLLLLLLRGDGTWSCPWLAGNHPCGWEGRNGG